MERTIHFHGILSKTPKLQTNEKNHQTNPERGHSTGHLTSIPEDCQDDEIQRKTEKLSQIRGE